METLKTLMLKLIPAKSIETFAIKLALRFNQKDNDEETLMLVTEKLLFRCKLLYELAHLLRNIFKLI